MISSHSESEIQRLIVEAVREHNVLPLTGRCNLNCIFCSHGQNPPGTLAFSFPPLLFDQIVGLIDCLNPGEKIVIGESATRLREGEPLTHPHFFAVLEKLRRTFPETLLQVTTNGSLLDDNAIKRLSEFSPLDIIVSLNSALQEGRRLLMKDSEPANAIAAVEKLRLAEISFHGSLVALPHLIGWDNFTTTLHYLNQAGAQTIRILLPGYTRCSSHELVPPAGMIEACFRLVADCRKSFDAPLLIEPPLVEDLDPIVEGVIPASPACKAGIMAGDMIMTVDDRRPATRVEAFNIISSAKNPLIATMRGHKCNTVTLNKEQNQASGLAMAYDLDPEQAERVRRKLSGQGKTIMLVSQPALRLWQLGIERFKIPGLTLKSVPATFFGGSISCAGLLTAKDFQAVIDTIPELYKYNKILLPSTAFDGMGRDLNGVHYLALQRAGLMPVLIA